MMPSLTQEQLKEHLWYDPVVGVFVRKKAHGSNNPVGRVSTTRTTGGYIVICVLGRSYRAHRLAWLYVHGHFPAGDVDHKNRITSDNRISNLRDCTVSQNNANARCKKSSKTGVKGVELNRSGKFVPSTKINGRKTYLGSYETIEEASEVYLNKLKEIHGDFASC